jgi:SAM-dependent methyltransferase
MGAPAEHWDSVYTSHSPSDLSWYEEQPALSMRLLRAYAPPPAAVVDVGAGAALLGEALLSQGWDDVTLLDVSERALAVARDRLAGDHRAVLVVADVLQWRPERTFDAWHDRAVFHFLVAAEDRNRYAATAAEAVRPGGILVVGAFAADGPTSCSGLPTARYDADALAGAFAGAFLPKHSEQEEHLTPGGAVQAFTWVVLRRR